MDRHRLVVLALDQVIPLDVAIPMQVFAVESSQYYDVRTASVDGESVAVAGGGMRLMPDAGIQAVADADTVIVPGYSNAAGGSIDPRAVAALRVAADRGARVASICSGAFALARAGLLDGFRVTTHWALGDELARTFPEVTVDAAALFIDNGRIMTSGGVTAGIDLALHILRTDLGASVARHVAKRIVMAPRPGGSQGQFAEASASPADDVDIAAVQRWMVEALDRPITVAGMAERTHLSVRQFHRRFVAVSGATPLSWLQGQRIQRAKDLLETTDQPIETVARLSGLGTAANFRALFRRATGVPPRSYRDAFSASASLGVA